MERISQKKISEERSKKRASGKLNIKLPRGLRIDTGSPQAIKIGSDTAVKNSCRWVK